MDSGRVHISFALAVLVLSITAAAFACQRENEAAPEPTVVANIASLTPEPTPVVWTKISTDHIPSTCEASSWRPTHHRHFIQWSRDDSLLIFDFDDAVWALTLEDSHLSKVVEATLGVGRGVLHLPIREEAPTRWRAANFGVHAHLSPDGTRVAYSSCQYDSMREKSGRPGFFHPVTVFTANEGPKLRYVHRVGYEIATVNIDGTDQRRLTDNDKLEHYPVWSPDGTRLAHIVSGFEVNSIGYDEEGTSLTVRPLGGLSPLDGTPEFMGAGLYPPAWSPDGTRIAFVYQQQLTEEEMRNIRSPKGEVITHNPNPQFIYIIDADGTDPVRIAEASTPPTWSPDSREVAFAHTNATSGESAIYVAGADGTDIRRIWNGEPDNLPPIKRTSWSPDVSELLVVSGYLWTIGPDGNDIRHLATSTLQVAPDEAKRDSDGSVWVRGPVRPGIKLKDGSPIPRLDLDDAVWSSDGSRIAVYGWGRDRIPASFRIITMARDGTDVRVVVKVHADRGMYAPPPPPSEGSMDAFRPATNVDVTPCSAGLVVSEPEEHPGLVADCEALLGGRDMLAGTAPLGWAADVPISEWEGVELKRLPRRVKYLRLPDSGLTGSIPPELGSLDWLEVLDLSSNYLRGPIPAELDNLRRLLWLRLGGNYLSGCTPAELANLDLVSQSFPLEQCPSSDSKGSTP